MAPPPYPPVDQPVTQDEAGYPIGMGPTLQSLPQQQGYPAQVDYTNPQQGYMLQPPPYTYSHVSIRSNLK